MLDRLLYQRFHGAGADAARRSVDDSKQRRFVARIIEHAQDRRGCLSLRAVVERLAADEDVGHFAHGGVPFRTGGAVRWCGIKWRSRGLDAGLGQRCLMSATIWAASSVSSWHCRITGGRPPAARGAQDFVVSVSIESDQTIGKIQNRPGRCGSYLPGERRWLRANRVGIAGMCSTSAPAPAVNGLIVVADDAQIAVAAGQRFDDAVLAAVGVLIFVDQQMDRIALPRRGELWETARTALA